MVTRTDNSKLAGETQGLTAAEQATLDLLMKKAGTNTTPTAGNSPPQNTGIPGTGFLMFDKHLAAGHMAWQGPFTSIEGEHHVLRADVTQEHGYDVAIFKPSPVKGEAWKLVDEFHVPPFGDSKIGVDVQSKTFGRMKASPWKTRTSERSAVRFQVLDKTGDRPDQPVV